MFPPLTCALTQGRHGYKCIIWAAEITRNMSLLPFIMDMPVHNEVVRTGSGFGEDLE